jgi:hypothetical protein
MKIFVNLIQPFKFLRFIELFLFLADGFCYFLNKITDFYFQRQPKNTLPNTFKQALISLFDW